MSNLSYFICSDKINLKTEREEEYDILILFPDMYYKSVINKKTDVNKKLLLENIFAKKIENFFQKEIKYIYFTNIEKEEIVFAIDLEKINNYISMNDIKYKKMFIVDQIVDNKNFIFKDNKIFSLIKTEEGYFELISKQILNPNIITTDFELNENSINKKGISLLNFDLSFMESKIKGLLIINSLFLVILFSIFFIVNYNVDNKINQKIDFIKNSKLPLSMVQLDSILVKKEKSVGDLFVIKNNFIDFQNNFSNKYSFKSVLIDNKSINISFLKEDEIKIKNDKNINKYIKDNLTLKKDSND